MPSKVLLVDDDPGTIHLLRRMLQPTFELRYALSGQAALDMMAQWQPDVVLLDSQMPGLSGAEVCLRMRADPALAGLPIIFVTSRIEPEAEVAALGFGASDFIRKPFTEAQVLARVQARLRGAKAGGPAWPAPGAPPLAAPRGPLGTDPCILIVDDDTATVQAMHRALSPLSARILFATDGQQALQLARQHTPELVLLDINMPGLDGFAVLDALKADATLAQASVLVVTRFDDAGNEVRALKAGALDFIAKPYQTAVLQARVRNTLRLRATALAQAERAQWRRISDARVARIVADASDAIITADASGEVVLFNAAAGRLLGQDPATAMGRPLADVLPAALAAQGSAQLAGGAGTGAPPGPVPPSVPRSPGAPGAPGASGAPILLGAADGSSHQVVVSASATGTGTDRLSTLVLRDVTAQARADAADRARLQAEATARSKAVLLSYLAHEIGNPLNGILGFTQLMQADAAHPLPEPQAQRLTQLAKAGGHLLALMRDVLDLQRLEAGRFDLQLAAVDARQAARQVVLALAPQAEASGVVLTLADGAEARVMADATRLHQCLLNLVGNAVKYNRAGGIVSLRVRPAGRRLAFDVEDNGPGLSAEQQAHLFEPFNRLGQGAAVQGTGMGLVLTRLIAAAMDGSVVVASEAGRGSRFTLDLPTARP